MVQVVVEGTHLEGEVDKDISHFEEWFATELGNGKLTKPERAILKTYLFFKLKGEKSDGT